jgi:hypothetical protein
MNGCNDAIPTNEEKAKLRKEFNTVEPFGAFGFFEDPSGLFLRDKADGDRPILLL